jgi:TPR repeat protein
MGKIVIVISLLFAVLTSPVYAQDYEKGLAAHKRFDHATALREWRPLAWRGNVSAQSRMAELYYRGGRGVPENPTEAARWARLAAEQGDAFAQTLLGKYHSYGLGGMSKDYTKAVKWYRLAADQGEAEAQSSLGYMYMRGRGVPQDYVRAYMWFVIAAATQENKLTASTRDNIAQKMKPAHIVEAQRMAQEWLSANTRYR